MDPMPERQRDPLLAVRVLIIAAVVGAPILFDLGTVKPFDVVKTTAVFFFGLLAFGAFVAQVLRGRARVRRFTMLYLAGGFLLVSAIGTALSSTHWTALFGWYGRYDGLVTLIVFVGYFFVIACVYRERRRDPSELVWAMAAGALILAAYVLIQVLRLDPIHWAQPGGNAIYVANFGTMGNSNFAGGYLGLTLPWVYLAIRSVAGWKRVGVVILGLAQLTALWYTDARNGLMALAAAAAMLLFINRKRVPLILKIGAVTAALAAFLVAVVIIWHPGAKQAPAPLRRFDVFQSTTIKVRGYWWLAGLKMFAERPVLGWGPESYVTHNSQFLPRSGAALPTIETADEPHNVFVRHLADTGVIGFGIYLSLLIFAFLRLFKRLRMRPGDNDAVVITFATLLAGYIGQAMFSIDVTAIGLVSWVTLGVIAALADPPAIEAVAPLKWRRARVAPAIVVVIALILAFFSTAPLRADHEARLARRLANADRAQSEVLTHLSRAMSLVPWEPIYHGFAGDYLEQQAVAESDPTARRQLLEDAVRYQADMDRLQPGYSQWKYSLAKATASLAAVGGATFEDAEQLYADADRLAPNDWRVVTGQAEMYNLWAQFGKDRSLAPSLLCQALERSREAVSLRPIESRPWLALGKTLARLGHLRESVGPLRHAAQAGDTSNGLATRILDEVNRLMKLPKAKRPPVVKC